MPDYKLENVETMVPILVNSCACGDPVCDECKMLDIYATAIHSVLVAHGVLPAHHTACYLLARQLLTRSNNTLAEVVNEGASLARN